MLSGNFEMMRQEQYQDLLREAKQERLLTASRSGQRQQGRFLLNLVGIFTWKEVKNQSPARLKRATL